MSQELSRVNAEPALQPFIRTIATGSDPDIESQLFKKSYESNILKFTPKDATKRFGDQAMFEAWKAGGREIYWLLGDQDDLAGIIWYGRKDFPLDVELSERPDETFAIRLYEGYSGHGLAVPAMRQTLRLHQQMAEKNGQTLHGIWLETDTDNPAALKVYARFGYQEVHRTSERVTMVLPGSEIRRIVSQPDTA